MKRKSLHVNNQKIDGWYCYVRQEINEKGKLNAFLFSLRKHGTLSLGFHDLQELRNYRKAIRGSGMCLFCGELDFSVLVEHHPFGKKCSKFHITMCANCHRRLHYVLGGRGYRGWYKEAKEEK